MERDTPDSLTVSTQECFVDASVPAVCNYFGVAGVRNTRSSNTSNCLTNCLTRIGAFVGSAIREIDNVCNYILSS